MLARKLVCAEADRFFSAGRSKFKDYPREFITEKPPLHAVVIWTAATLWGNPGDDLIGIGNVARLAMHAIRRI
jgi:hypothetical protein